MRSGKTSTQKEKKRTSPLKGFRVYIFESSIKMNSGNLRSNKLMNLFIAGVVTSGIGFVLILVFGVILKTPLFIKMEDVQRQLALENRSALSLYARLGEIHQQIEYLSLKERKIALIMGKKAPSEGQLLGEGGRESWMPPADMMVAYTGNGILRHIDRVMSEEHTELLKREQELSYLARSMSLQREKWLRIPSIHPVQGTETSPFGWRNSPFGYGREFHPGIDIAARLGTPVMATAAGVVIWVGWDAGFGKTVKIRHVDGIVTLFGHLSRYFVHMGDRVKRGQVIAALGNTGMSTGPHLHYEILVNAKPVNPLRYFIVNSLPKIRVAMNRQRF
ncbi:peptidase M23B [Leptospirillum ferriphilum]|jgi:murein DD-endopeptidase MepM/ murein hydrolase activator NlpD|uniref:Peptidase M23B n=3 Tax=Leptospirillum TaxID=179 RepID=A0A094YKF1_9BACT|nr:MAG: Putative peptidase, M23B family [Leptospirillum sp. Group II '5-way CG']KGA93691.1 peptidase M23B [Leptospirillum ferriphilum]